MIEKDVLAENGRSQSRRQPWRDQHRRNADPEAVESAVARQPGAVGRGVVMVEPPRHDVDGEAIEDVTMLEVQMMYRPGRRLRLVQRAHAVVQAARGRRMREQAVRPCRSWHR